MSDKEMEAAREAAWQKHIQYRRPHQMPSADEIFEYKKGFSAGYNAAQPKPCVWTLSSIYGIEHSYKVGCKGVLLVAKGFTHCPYCGGKIEEKGT